MGYSTEFSGDLQFTNITVPMLAKLAEFMGEDCRDHPEWKTSKELYYIDLELKKDMSGIRWNGAEKTYDMVDLVNLVIQEMRKEFPDFGLSGVMTAQGEDLEDRWQLYIGDDGFAHKRDVKMVGDKVTCPHCKEQFYLKAKS